MCGLNSSLAWRMAAEVVLDAEHVDVVLEIVAQRLEDVVLGPPLRRRDVVTGDVVGRHQVVVHQHEHAKLSHRWPRMILRLTVSDHDDTDRAARNESLRDRAAGRRRQDLAQVPVDAALAPPVARIAERHLFVAHAVPPRASCAGADGRRRRRARGSGAPSLRCASCRTRSRSAARAAAAPGRSAAASD